MDRGNVRSMRRPSLDAMTESTKTMRERMLAGELYIADDPVLGEESARAQSLSHRYNTMDPTDAAGRRAVMEELLGAFGEDSEVPPVPLRLRLQHDDRGAHVRELEPHVARRRPRHDR